MVVLIGCRLSLKGVIEEFTCNLIVYCNGCLLFIFQSNNSKGSGLLKPQGV